MWPFALRVWLGLFGFFFFVVVVVVVVSFVLGGVFLVGGVVAFFFFFFFWCVCAYVPPRPPHTHTQTHTVIRDYTSMHTSLGTLENTVPGRIGG